MKKVVQKFDSFEAAARADRAYYQSLTPGQRMNILLELVARYRESFGEAGERFDKVYRIVKLRGR